ncbi:MAG: sodium:alanine symporter family protein [Clostridia bacterium]|nr:sodium:alanine symporter family protein [Clostridia bacterium]
MKYLGQALLGAGMPLLLLITGLYFALVLGKYMLRAPRKCFSALHRGGGERGSSARALAVALAGTLGVGNIAGVAAAIAAGGAGAVFWMLLAAFVAMPLKYAEITLSQVYRSYDAEGRPHGGAPYYIKAVLGGRLGWIMSVLFALLLVFCTLTLGSLLQSRAAAEAVSGVFGVPEAAVGTVLALLAALVLLSGSELAERVLSVLVPFLCVGFTVAAVALLILRRAALPAAFAAIWQGAFTPKAGVGGVLGICTSRALRLGVARGLVSNEAGCGTAPTAHAAANAKIPAAQGLWGILEVFVDTVLLCTLTALVILVTAGENAGAGVMLAISAFGAGLGPCLPPLIALSVFLFAFATVLCWTHYGIEALAYLTGSARGKRLLILAACLTTALGAVTAPTLVWGATDLVLALMTLLNLAVLLVAHPTILSETRRLFLS